MIMSNFNFKLNKRGERKFLSIPVSQISNYSPGAQLDFSNCFRHQLEELNGKLEFDYLVREYLFILVGKHNDSNSAPKTLEKLYLQRALVQFFSYSVNACLLSDWKTALELFETVYE